MRIIAQHGEGSASHCIELSLRCEAIRPKRRCDLSQGCLTQPCTPRNFLIIRGTEVHNASKVLVPFDDMQHAYGRVDGKLDRKAVTILSFLIESVGVPAGIHKQRLTLAFFQIRLKRMLTE